LWLQYHTGLTFRTQLGRILKTVVFVTFFSTAFHAFLSTSDVYSFLYVFRVFTPTLNQFECLSVFATTSLLICRFLQLCYFSLYFYSTFRMQ
jgi:hypothetical protein